MFRLLLLSLLLLPFSLSVEANYDYICFTEEGDGEWSECTDGGYGEWDTDTHCRVYTGTRTQGAAWIWGNTREGCSGRRGFRGADARANGNTFDVNVRGANGEKCYLGTNGESAWDTAYNYDLDCILEAYAAEPRVDDQDCRNEVGGDPEGAQREEFIACLVDAIERIFVTDAFLEIGGDNIPFQQEACQFEQCDDLPPLCASTFRDPFEWHNGDDFTGPDPLRCLFDETIGGGDGGNDNDDVVPGVDLAPICDTATISQGGCADIPGVTPLPDAPGGNKKYLLPAAASGADFDYELVEIGNQCWFAENSREGTGQYFGGVANEPADGAGLLYTYQEVMNGNPGERNQGVCPAGWHVPSDCEFMAMEGSLGLSEVDQVKVWTDTHPELWQKLKDGGSSGFDQVATGYWDPTGGGWWGPQETQLHISGNAPGVGGAMMKRYGTYFSDYYYRFQGAPDSGYRFGLRCLHDGEGVLGADLIGGAGNNGGAFRSASGQNITGPNGATNQAVIDLADHGFDPDGADPHIIVSERNYNASSTDGNTMDASFCGFAKNSKLVFTVTCWASPNNSGGTVQSTFDWLAVQARDQDTVASDQNITGPDAATNQAVIDLADHGFDPDGADPHIIVSERNYNASSTDGNTMDASFCGVAKNSKLVFTVTCWASPNNSGGSVQSTFDWLAIQPTDGDAVASDQNITGPDAATNQAVIDLADHGFDPDGADPHIIVSEHNYNASSADGNTMDASFCGFTKNSKLVFTVTCWASPDNSGGTVQSTFDWLAVQTEGDVAVGELETQTVRVDCNSGATSGCTATCPQGTTVVGGGVDWVATNGTCHMVESLPDGNNGWAGGTAASNSQTTSCTASVEAICVVEPELETQTIRANCPAGRTSQCNATCPAGTIAMGGGVDWLATDGTCHVVESRPFGNGWSGGTAATNTQTNSCTAAVEVICVEAPAIDAEVVRTDCTANRTSGCTATCPAGTAVVGGGVDWIATDGTCHVVESLPDGNNGWSGGTAATNTPTNSCTAAVEAVCASLPADGERPNGRGGFPGCVDNFDGEDQPAGCDFGTAGVNDTLDPVHGDICRMEVCDFAGNCSICDPSPPLKYDDTDPCTGVDGGLGKTADGTLCGECDPDDDDCLCIRGDASKCRDDGPINCYTNPFNDRCPGFQNPACLIDPFTPGCPVVNPCYPVPVYDGLRCPLDAVRFCARNPYHYGCNLACESGDINCDPVPPAAD